MKKILFFIAIFISAIAYSQPQTIYKVASIAAMKAYFGAAQRIHVTATNQDFIYCPGCTPDEITIFDGVGARNWKLTPDIDTVDVDYPLQSNGSGGLQLSQSFIDSFQVKDADLTTIAGLTATTDNFLVSVSSAWASRTPAQVKTTLSINNVDNTSDATKNSATATLTNKRWTPRVGTTTSSATPTINTDNVDIYKLTAQTADITSFTTNLSGTPVDGDILEIQITGTAARALTFGASFVSSTVTIPTTTVTTVTLTVIFQYFTTSSYGNNKWVCVNSF